MESNFRTPSNLYEQFELTARERKDQIALIEPAGPNTADFKAWTFGEFHKRVCQHQQALYRAGFQPNDSLLVVLPASFEMYALVSALFASGIVPVFIDHTMHRSQFLKAIQSANLKGVLAVPKLLKYWWAISGLRKPQKFCLSTSGFGYQKWDLKQPGSSDIRCPAVAEDATGLITFTSGSSGTPKAANRTNRILFAQREISRSLWKDSEGDIEITLFPMVVFNNLLSGSTTVLPNIEGLPMGRQVGKNIITQIQQHGINRLALQPSFLYQLAQQYESPISQVEKLVVGGATVPNWLIKKSSALFPKSQSYIVYGSTEAEPISYCLFEDAINQKVNGYLVGRPISDIQVMFKNDEILLAGPHVVQSYLFQAEENNVLKIRDENNKVWHRTKDIGSLNQRGEIILHGRSENLIGRAGTPPFPAEHAIENLIQSRAAIIEAGGVIGLFLQTKETSEYIAELQNILSEFHFSFKEIKIFWDYEIPVDRRHFWRINRSLLRKNLRSL